MTTSNVHGSDNSAILVQLCVKILKRMSPEGMTTKELAAALDKEVVPGFDGISSSILSSKLNAVFRRSHNDTHNPSNDHLNDLPLTRSQSSEIPRRLVYRYSPPKKESQHSASEHSHETNVSSPETERIFKRQRENPEEKVSEDMVSTKTVPEEKVSQVSEDDLASNSDVPNEPLTPKEENTEEPSWPSAKRLKDREITSLSPHSPPAQTKASDDTEQSTAKCPNTPPSTNLITSRKAQVLANASKPNLYYDAVGLDTVAAAFSPQSQSTEIGLTSCHSPKTTELDQWSDIFSPEDLGLNELDKFFC